MKFETFRFVQMSDAQFGFGESYDDDINTFRQAVRQINDLRPDFVVNCGGDLGITTTDHSAFDDFNRIRAQLDMPSYCAVGNHDLIEDQPSPGNLEIYRRLMGKDYYSFDHKGHAFIVVNTQLWKRPASAEAEAESQDEWFTKALHSASDQGRPVFVVGHIPLFRKDVEEDEDPFVLPRPKRKSVLTLFERHGVVAMLSGHTHSFMANEHKGIQLVTCETTSRNHDGRPLGFRVWRVTGTEPPTHEFVAVENHQFEDEEPTTGEAK